MGHNRWLTAIITCLYATHTYAWGQMGHRVVAEIASHHLEPQVAQHINQLTGGHSLAELSTWLDEVRSDKAYKLYAPWHFILWPTDGHVETMTHPRQGDIITGYTTAKSILQHSTDPQKRQEALAILVHLVGDAHQPLHVNNGEDKGANQCIVGWFSKQRKMRLHKVWDSVMLNGMGLSYTELAHFLDHSTDAEITALQRTPIEAWLRESYALHAVVYPASDTWHSYCQADKDAAIPVLSYRYIYQQKPIMEKRLLQAGVRLAGILNQLFK
jgi:hypothetical protein